MKHESGEMPPATASRLPQYFRCLRELLLENCLRVTSERIARDTGFHTAQVRSDLRWFDGAGQRGYGYAVKGLYTEIATYLGTGEGYRAVCIVPEKKTEGSPESEILGRCGVRLAAYLPETEEDEALAKQLARIAPELGVIAPCCRTPRRDARLLAESGVKGILNYSDCVLTGFDGIAVQNRALSDDVLLLCCEMKTKGEAAL